MHTAIALSIFLIETTAVSLSAPASTVRYALENQIQAHRSDYLAAKMSLFLSTVFSPGSLSVRHWQDEYSCQVSHEERS